MRNKTFRKFIVLLKERRYLYNIKYSPYQPPGIFNTPLGVVLLKIITILSKGKYDDIFDHGNNVKFILSCELFFCLNDNNMFIIIIITIQTRLKLFTSR